MDISLFHVVLNSIWGKINFRNVTASFNEIHNLTLNNGAGEVVFNNTKTTFRSYQAYINGKPVEIKRYTACGKLCGKCG